MLRCAEVLKAAQRCPVWGSGLSTSPGSLYISEGALFVTALIQTITVCLLIVCLYDYHHYLFRYVHLSLSISIILHMDSIRILFCIILLST